MKRIFFALLLLCSILTIQSQTIKVTVLEESSNLGAIQATVTIKGTTNGTATDFDGNYSFFALQYCKLERTSF